MRLVFSTFRSSLSFTISLRKAVPVIDAVLKLVEGSELETEKFTILDLCCGKGYLSMLLSEMVRAGVHLFLGLEPTFSHQYLRW